MVTSSGSKLLVSLNLASHCIDVKINLLKQKNDVKKFSSDYKSHKQTSSGPKLSGETQIDQSSKL